MQCRRLMLKRCECCFRSLCGRLRLKNVPSRQRRSWWRTPTAARSLSASPWCLCRSQCHQASTCSTSPKIDKNKCVITTSTYTVCKLPCISINAKLNFPVWTHTKWSESQVSRPWFFSPYCHISLPHTCHLIFKYPKNFFQVKMRFAPYYFQPCIKELL